jgi:hypothetical protein
MTGPDGRFTVDKHECNPRKIKVEARFESDDLRVTGSGSVGWYLLKETTSTIEPGTLDLGDEPFGGETGDQSTTQARTDAQTWMIYRKALDHTASIGFPFLNKVTAHNPATLTTGGSRPRTRSCRTSTSTRPTPTASTCCCTSWGTRGCTRT